MLLAGVATAALAQTPADLPANYSVELDNRYVRVTRASFAPREKVAVHLHPTYPTVYVYLTGGGAMRFEHYEDSKPTYTVERRPVVAGGIRYNRNWHDETHEIEYLGDTPTEYLRVELKTVPDDPHPDARMAADEPGPIEDAQVFVRRYLCRAGAECALPSRPAVVVTLEDRDFLWVDPARTEPQVNGKSQPLHQIWIELKTEPKP